MDIVVGNARRDLVQPDMMDAYMGHVNKILRGNPELSGASKDSVGRKVSKQSRDYYNGKVSNINDSIAEFQNLHPFVFQHPNKFVDVCAMLKDNAIALPVQTSGAVVQNVLSVGGVLLGIFSGLIQRYKGGTGYDLQIELCDVLGHLYKVFAVDLPNIIKNHSELRRLTTAASCMELSAKIRFHKKNHILFHVKKVGEIQTKAALWGATGPHSVYYDITNAVQDLEDTCTDAAFELHFLENDNIAADR